MQPLSPIPHLLLSRMAHIGAAPDDNEEVQLQKTLLVAFAGIMAPFALLWGSIYLLSGEYLAGSIPIFYAGVSMLSLLLFSRSKRYELLRTSQLSFSLLLPFFLMIALGGFVSSGAVVIWALTAPLGALVFSGRRYATRWFIGYIAVLISGMFLGSVFRTGNNLSQSLITIFFVMNIAGMSLVAFVLVRYFVGEKNLSLRILQSRNQWITEAFSAYISPNLVAHLVKNPDELKLGGERRECSFVFTDLVGFTSLVEQSNPEELVRILNRYLKGMTEIVFRYEGTLSKIVGDAMAVIFSAPIVQPDHADRAIACSLEMHRYAEDFSKKNVLNGIAFGLTRIGVHTGSVIVGNVGSTDQLDYRALGDPVNTGARLESANRQLGTWICASEATVNACSDFSGRPIGSLLLKGKRQIVKAYEPLDPADARVLYLDEYCDAFARMSAAEPTALPLFKNLSKHYPDDRVIQLHLKRLQSGDASNYFDLSH